MTQINNDITRKNLQRLIKKDGRSMAAVSKAAGLAHSAVFDIISGKTNSPKISSLQEISVALGCRLEDIINPSPRLVNVVGYVGAGAMIYAIDDHAKGAGLDEVDAPPGVDSRKIVALRVQGDSMYPAYKDGNILYYTKDCDFDEACLGEECVIKLKDGRVYVKTLMRGTKPNRFTLQSYNSPPIYDVEIEWACKVLWVKK